MLKSISIFVAALSLSILPSVAQKTYPIGVNGSGSGISLSTTSASTIVVNLQVDVERVIVGPYARYAQEYLGVRAPLVAKSTASIVSADVALAPDDFYVASDAMLTYSGSEELKSVAGVLPIDISSSDVLSVEDAAEAAAEAIFNIRTLRRDLLSGELGEGFYGGGLAASLERLEYEERQYVEMFMGRTVSSRERITRFVTLDGTESRYMVCRFNPAEGIVSNSDLSAEPILLQLTPIEEHEEVEEPIVDSKSRKVTFKLPTTVRCDLYNNTALIASKSMPLIDFGYDYYHIITEK